MRSFFTNIRLPGFSELTGLAALDKEIEKLKELRDSYCEENKAYYGEYLAALLND